MEPAPSDFVAAISSYAWPASEPIYYVDLLGRAGGNAYPANPCLFLFREAIRGEAGFGSLTEFWASAWFNFLEDCGDLDSFEGQGSEGIYQALNEVESRKNVDELLGEARSDAVAVPRRPASCFVVFDSPNLKALAGTDEHGFFALIWRRWSD